MVNLLLSQDADPNWIWRLLQNMRKGALGKNLIIVSLRNAVRKLSLFLNLLYPI